MTAALSRRPEFGYRRNVRIYNHVARLVTSPDDRTLVIFGAGHLGWLRHDFASDPDLRLRKLEKLVRLP